MTKKIVTLFLALYIAHFSLSAMEGLNKQFVQKSKLFAEETKGVLTELWYHNVSLLQMNINLNNQMQDEAAKSLFTIAQMIKKINDSDDNTFNVLHCIKKLEDFYNHYDSIIKTDDSNSDNTIFTTNTVPQEFVEKQISIFNKLFDLYNKVTEDQQNLSI